MLVGNSYVTNSAQTSSEKSNVKVSTQYSQDRYLIKTTTLSFVSMAALISFSIFFLRFALPRTGHYFLDRVAIEREWNVDCSGESHGSRHPYL